MSECYLCFQEYPSERMHDDFICVYCFQDTDIPALIEENQKLKIKNPFTRYLPDSVRLQIFKEAEYVCQYCYEKQANQIDHIIPWSFLLRHDSDNLVASCGRCNRLASNKIFASIEEKRIFIRNILLARRRKKIIPIWTKQELDKMSYELRTGFKVVVKNDTEAQKVALELKSKGYTVRY